MSTPAADDEARLAFAGLLARPLVTPATDPDLHRSLVVHRKEVADLARRLGYRVQVVGRAIRLHRSAVDGTVIAPPPPLDRPSRRVLAIACCLAAACEQSDGAVTLQQLSDLVRETSAATPTRLRAYDPDAFVERRRLVKAAQVLEHWGVLRRRTGTETDLSEWAEGQGGIGAGYEVDPDALLLFVSHDPPGAGANAASPSLVLLRRLVETPVVTYADLPDDDADLLRSTRGLRAHDVMTVTGGTVETRAEGCVVIMPTGLGPDPTTVDWPRANAASWVALLAADAAGSHGSRGADGVVTLTASEVGELVSELLERHRRYLTRQLRDKPDAVRVEVERQLRHLGLLVVTPDGSWRLAAAAGRFRAPVVTTVDTAQQLTLGEDES